MGGKTTFSQVDMVAGFHQYELDDESKEKAAAICDWGLFEYNVMTFGLTNAPATFQRGMDELAADVWTYIC